MTHKQSTHTRELLITAANQVLLSQGAAQLTLDAVAQAAGVSKGGLLYHFASKDALIEAMVEHYVTHFESRLARYPDAAHHWLRAYIQAAMTEDPEETAFSAAVLAAVAINPTLLEPLRAAYQGWHTQLDAAPDPVLAAIIRLALDGLWLADLLNLAPPPPHLRAQILQRLLSWTETPTS